MLHLLISFILLYFGSQGLRYSPTFCLDLCWAISFCSLLPLHVYKDRSLPSLNSLVNTNTLIPITCCTGYRRYPLLFEILDPYCAPITPLCIDFRYTWNVHSYTTPPTFCLNLRWAISFCSLLPLHVYKDRSLPSLSSLVNTNTLIPITCSAGYRHDPLRFEISDSYCAPITPLCIDFRYTWNIPSHTPTLKPVQYLQLPKYITATITQLCTAHGYFASYLSNIIISDFYNNPTYLYGALVQSLTHILLYCKHTYQIWQKILKQLDSWTPFIWVISNDRNVLVKLVTELHIGRNLMWFLTYVLGCVQLV